MADPYNGILSLSPTLSPTLSPRLKQHQEMVKLLRKGQQPDMVDVRRREAELSKYLGAPDYDAQIDKSREDAKLQFFLQMAQRGFAAAGAAPRRGESTVSTLSRELFSPLAGDASKLAGQFTKEKRAIDTAKRAGTRQLRLAALQQSQAGQASLSKLAFDLLPKQVTPTKPTITDMSFVIENVPDPKNPGKFIQGPPSSMKESKGLLIKGVLSQFVPSLDGLKNIPISIGSGENQYTIYEKPVKAPKPSGLNDLNFMASFQGSLSQFGKLQRTLGLGRSSVRWNAKKFAQNPGLKPGKNFPMERVLGLDKSRNIVTGELAASQQESYANNLRSSYKALFDLVKPGDEPTNLGVAFASQELGKSPEDLGLPKLTEKRPDLTQTRQQVTDPRAVQSAYEGAKKQFKENGVKNTLDGLPFGANNANLRTGIARLVLYNELGVPFGSQTVSPEPIDEGADATEVLDRSRLVRELDPRSIQTRIIAENISNATGLGSKLRTQTADTTGKRLTVVQKELDLKQGILDKALNDRGGKVIGEAVSKSVAMLAALDRLDIKMKVGNAPGFITGPAIGAVEQYTGLNINFLQSDAGKKAASEFRAMLPIVQELFSRDLLRATGEQRISNADLVGAQKTLVKLNQSEGFNAATLKELRGYIKNLVTTSLDYVGTYALPERTIESMAKLGVPVKDIKGKNDFYSPFLANRNYAVTGEPVPSFSKAYIKQLRDDSIFGYVAETGASAKFPVSYRLRLTNEDGIPLRNKDNTFKTQSFVKEEGWQSKVKPEVLKYNRNFLANTYNLGR